MSNVKQKLVQPIRAVRMRLLLNTKTRWISSMASWWFFPATLFLVPYDLIYEITVITYSGLRHQVTPSRSTCHPASCTSSMPKYTEHATRIYRVRSIAIVPIVRQPISGSVNTSNSQFRSYPPKSAYIFNFVWPMSVNNMVYQLFIGCTATDTIHPLFTIRY